MPASSEEEGSTVESDGPVVPSSTYDLLAERLGAIAQRLTDSATTLNTERAGVFAAVPLELAEQDRLHTEQPSVPRDAVCVGDLLVFGYNPSGGLGRNRRAEDVFALFRLSQAAANDWDFAPLPIDDPDWFLADSSFQRDVSELFTYYADSRLLGLQLRGDLLLMIFAVGPSEQDLRVLRWRVTRGRPIYIDAYGDQDLVAADRYDFEWRDAGREHLSDGRWPHMNIADVVFIGIERGKLEFRVNDAVAGGRTVLTETLQELEQSMAEVRVGYAELDEVVLLRVQPYREPTERFYVFNRLTRAVSRADAVGRNCHQLPEGQGIVFPGGYHLQNGETKVFSTDANGFVFHAVHRSPNGEDMLYVYSRAATGEYLLCAYNVVARTMANPVTSHGYALFADGVIVMIRHSPDPQRVHTIAVYTSPFCAADRYQPAVASDSFFGRIGNPELVRVLGECFSLARDARQPSFNAEVFETFVTRSTALLDRHSWLGQPDAHGIGGLLVELRRASGSVLDEFAATVSAKQEAAARLADLERAVGDFTASGELEIRDAAAYIDLLARGRAVIGQAAEAGEIRYVDATVLAALRTRAEQTSLNLAQRAIEFLDGDGALDPLLAVMNDAETSGQRAPTAATVSLLAAEVDTAGQRLVLLTEVVGGLDVADPTRKTAVLTRLSDALARRNAVRAGLDRRADALRTTEQSAGFTASMAVIAQRAQASIMSADSAAACDAAMASLTAELENIELAHGVVAQFAEAIATKRDELHTAFSQRRETLAAERTGRIERLAASAQRVLATISTRAVTMPDRGAVDAFFATDPLANKIRTSITELRASGEAGRAGELEVALATARDTARRAVTDRSELFEAGTVKIGRWKIGVNSEPFELRLVADEGRFRVRLAGTELALPLGSDALDPFTDLAGQTYPSETPAMARAVYLACEARRLGVAADRLGDLVSQRIDDGYEPGVHDADARRILTATTSMWSSAGLWYSGRVRAVAGTWLGQMSARERDDLGRELLAIRSLGTGTNGPGRSFTNLVDRAAPALTEIATEAGFSIDPPVCVEYLVGHGDDLAITAAAADAADTVARWATESRLDLRAATFGQIVRWAQDRCPELSTSTASEVAWRLRDPSVRPTAGIPASYEIDGLLSTHPTISTGVLRVEMGDAYTDFLTYRRDGLARFQAFSTARRTALTVERTRLDVDRLRPKVISSFVRNRLIDDVYFPLIGDNLARQLGLNGASQGLLLLISPPGYGKTTLVEYVADLLGFALVKINGPALGHGVTSLDPAAAPDAASAEELTKLNRSFAMGTNVICYLDDIQHASPEFLQKFIPLCDATRRIEGVLEGEARTFSLSGKRFVTVMAGNPYTSDGSTFRIPDMLANRADVFNLGDVVAGNAAAFAQSYIENACGVNETLAPLVTRGRRDLELLLQAAAGEQVRSDQLSQPYGATELSAMTKALGHLVRVRDQLLKVNSAYIASATTTDQMRGEPSFLLQGSYRNMARIAQRILPAMTADEVDAAVLDHYRQESQTLAAAAAWNQARLPAVLGTATPDDQARVADLRSRWSEANVGADPLSVIAASLKDIAAFMTPRS